LFLPSLGGALDAGDVSNHYISKSELEVNGMAINYSRCHRPSESLWKARTFPILNIWV